MINKNENPVEWALLFYELDDAREHLESLIEEMANDNSVSDVEFEIHLAHIFGHLNRAWNRRNQTENEALEKFSANSQFPTDLDLNS